MKSILRKIYWILSAQFGIDPRCFFRSIRGAPRFIRTLYLFKRKYKGRLKIQPCLHDWYEEGGATRTEYFWQDLVYAKKIFENQPVNPEGYLNGLENLAKILKKMACCIYRFR